MSQKRFLGLGLTILLFIGLLIAGGTALYRSGWSQGYMMGQLAASNDGGAMPYAPHYAGYLGRHLGALPFLCTAGLFVLGLAVTAKIFRAWAWKRTGKPDKDWFEHWHHHRPPWHGHPEKPDSEKTESTTSEAKTNEPKSEADH